MGIAETSERSVRPKIRRNVEHWINRETFEHGLISTIPESRQPRIFYPAESENFGSLITLLSEPELQALCDFFDFDNVERVKEV